MSAAFPTHDGRLEGHSCTHCRGITIPGNRVDIRVDYDHNWDTPLDAMMFENVTFHQLNVSLGDLKTKSDGHCEFALYLAKLMRKGLCEDLDFNAVEVFTTSDSDDPRDAGTLRFLVLVCLGKVECSGIKPNGIDLSRCYVWGSEVIDRPYELCDITADEGDATDEFFKIQRRVAENPLSSTTIHSIQTWLKQCEDNSKCAHKVCSLSESPFVPSRLVKVEAFMSSYRLHLIRGSCLPTTQYVALSYCWGGIQPMELTKDRISAYEDEIPWYNLPDTLKDAAKTAYLLGIPYIWIDSLCIAQDDQDEKMKEISQMTRVYTHASLTIMAKRGDKATDGFLQSRKLPSGTTSLPYKTDKTPNGRVTVTFWTASKNELNTALDTRGWVLQEHILSRRLLIFGTWSTEWGCRSQRGNLDGWFDRADINESPYSLKESWAESDLTATIETQAIEDSHVLDAIMFMSSNPDYRCRRPDDSLIFEAWGDILNSYCFRSLSDPNDRIFAISGLARGFACAMTVTAPNRYIAGIWERSMPGALLWTSASGDTVTSRATSYRAPSWSWMSVNGPTRTWLDEDHLESVSEVLSVHSVLSDPEMPYGAVSSAKLHIKGPAVEITWRYNQHEDSPSQYRLLGGEYPSGLLLSLDTPESDTDWRNVTLLAIDPGHGYGIGGIALIDDVEDSKPKNRVLYRKLGYFKDQPRKEDAKRFGTESVFSQLSAPNFPPLQEWPIKSFVVV